MAFIAFSLYWLVVKLCSTPFGRLLKAIRENELVVETFGRDIIRIKLNVMGLGSGIAAIAGAGTPGIVSIAMISIVLTPLHLPVEAIVVLLLAVNPLLDPVTTMTNTHSNCAAATIIASKK